MQEKEQIQYLEFKNIQNSEKQKFHSPITYTSKSIYTSTRQNMKHQTELLKPYLKSKVKQTVVSNSNHIKTSPQKSGYSTCEIISFSTQSTKGHNQKQILLKNYTEHQINNQQNAPNQNINPHNRLNKAKSDVKINKYSLNQKIKFHNTQQKLEELCEKGKNKNLNQQKYEQTFEQIQSLLKTMKLNQNRIKRLQKQIELKDKKIFQLQKANSLKLREKFKMESYLLPQNKYIKQDNRQNVRRLLKMLQMTSQYQQFAKLGLQDNGITLLSAANKRFKTKIDLPSEYHAKAKSNKFHYCTCNRQFIPEPYLWVPESIYEYGMQFLQQHQEKSNTQFAELSKSQYQLLLYELNKMWRQRQKKIINTIKHEKNLQIQKLKRKYNVAPSTERTCLSKRKQSKMC